jgi:hypothetical protein
MSLEAIRNAVRAQARAGLSAPAATDRDLTAAERAALRTARRRARRAANNQQEIAPPTGRFMWLAN